MTARIRFSITPTEIPHVNNLHHATMSWAITRALDGDLIVTIDDLYTADYDETKLPMLEAMAWLNVDWDEGVEYGGDHEPYKQSKKAKRYQAIFDQLRQTDGVHELSEGHWVLLDGEDVILENGRFSRPFRAAIDDHDMAATHIIHTPESGKAQFVQKLHKLLDWPLPKSILIPTLMTINGETLPERGFRLEDLQNQGFLPKALFNCFALLGWEREQSDILDKWQVRTQFAVDQLSPQPTLFDWGWLKIMNAHYIQKMGNEQVADGIRPFLEDAYGALPMADGWLTRLATLVKPSLQTFEDAIEVAEWSLSDDFEVSDEAEELIAAPETKPILSQAVAELATVVLLDEKTAVSIINGIQRRVKTPNAQQVSNTLQAVLTGSLAELPISQIMSILGKQTSLQRIANTLR